MIRSVGWTLGLVQFEQSHWAATWNIGKSFSNLLFSTKTTQTTIVGFTDILYNDNSNATDI